MTWLAERFFIDGRLIVVSVTLPADPLDLRPPKVRTEWAEKPQRLLPEQIAEFDAQHAMAVRVLRQRLAELQGATT